MTYRGERVSERERVRFRVLNKSRLWDFDEPRAYCLKNHEIYMSKGC